MAKILIFSDEYPPEIGGAGKVAETYAKILSEQGNEVTVLTRKIKGVSARGDNEYNVVECYVPSKLRFPFYINGVKFHEYDLIILNDIVSVLHAGAFFSSILLSRSIVMLHGSEPEIIFENISLSKKVLFFRFFYKRVLNNCFHLIAVSYYMKEKFLERTELYNLENKISVVYTPIDSDAVYSCYDKYFREKMGISSGAHIMMSAGRVVERKGYHNLLSVVSDLTELGVNVFWLIAGDGCYLPELKKLARCYGVESNIRFLGKVDRESLAYYYSNSDLFCLLSEFDESFGLVYVEAQFCGCPAVGYNRAGVREAIKDSETGYLIDDRVDLINIFKCGSYKDLDMKGSGSIFFLDSFKKHAFLSTLNGILFDEI